MPIFRSRSRDKYGRVSSPSTIACLGTNGRITYRLIALMLVRLRMSAEDCLEIYRDLCRKIFEPVWNASFFKYSSHNYEMELKEVISQRLGSGHQNDPLRDPFAEDGCKW